MQWFGVWFEHAFKYLRSEQNLRQRDEYHIQCISDVFPASSVHGALVHSTWTQELDRGPRMCLGVYRICIYVYYGINQKQNERTCRIGVKITAFQNMFIFELIYLI